MGAYRRLTETAVDERTSVLHPLGRPVLGEPLRAHPSEVFGIHAARYSQSGADQERGSRDEEDDDRPHKCCRMKMFERSMIVPRLRMRVCAFVYIVTVCCLEQVLGWLTPYHVASESGPRAKQLPIQSFV